MCVVYVGLCCWFIFDPLGPSQKIFKDNYVSCDDFVRAAALLTLFPGILFSALDKVIVMAPMRVILRDFVLGPGCLSLFGSIVAYAIYIIYGF
jgi:hypothetical protein